MKVHTSMLISSIFFSWYQGSNPGPVHASEEEPGGLLQLQEGLLASPGGERRVLPLTCLPSHWFFEMWSCCITWTSFELVILVLTPLKCWDLQMCANTLYKTFLYTVFVKHVYYVVEMIHNELMTLLKCAKFVIV